MSMSGKDTNTFLARRKREEATLKKCHLSWGCDFAGDYWLQRWSWRAGWRKEAGDMENVFESGQAGFDSQSCPFLGPGNSGKLFNLLRKLRIVTSPLQDVLGDSRVTNTTPEACYVSDELQMLLPLTLLTKSQQLEGQHRARTAQN